MSLADIIDTVSSVIESVTPTSGPHVRFVRAQVEDWMPLEEQAGTRSRLVLVEPVGGILEPRYVGLTLHYPSHDLVVSVTYARGDYRDPHLLASVAAEDLASIVTALAPPASWSAVATSLYPLLPVERYDVPAADGGTLATIYRLRLRAEWEVS